MKSLLRFLLRPQFERLLRIDPESKPGVYLEVFDGADVQNLNYWLELFLSAAIATFGLVLNSPAVVIGAMLVSPLMGPIIAAGLALAAADLYLGIKSMVQLALSTVGAIAVSALLVWALPFDAPTTEILARTRPNLLDLGVALFSGLAGSLIVSRSRSPQGGGVSALPGVAIAVALMPPLCTVGFGVGSGFRWPILAGAGLLYLTNLAAIIASAFVVFLAIRMDSLDVRLAIAAGLMERASHDAIYHRLERRTRISRALSKIGELRWRFVMLAVVLGILFIPLSTALVQLREEAIARDAISQAVAMISPREGVISQQDNIGGSGPIFVRLIVADPVDEEKVRDAERHLLRTTGREARLTVRRVAGEEELARLREGLADEAASHPQDLQTLQADLTARLQQALTEFWPEGWACLKDYELGFRPSDIVVRIVYESEQPFDATAQEVLAKALGARLSVAKLALVLNHAGPPPKPQEPVQKGAAAAQTTAGKKTSR